MFTLYRELIYIIEYLQIPGGVDSQSRSLDYYHCFGMPGGYSLSPSTSTLSNPAHILIGRNNRTSSSPQASSSASVHHQHHASPADPLQSTIAASGTFPRQSASPPWLFEEINEDEYDDTNSGREDTGQAIPIDVDPTFIREGRWPGTVKIVVEATTFW